MGYHWLVVVILALHFGYIAYLVLGGFLAWRWPKAIWPHVAVSVWAVLIVLSWVDCPLTWAEYWARARAGQDVPSTGFIDRYLTNVVYPARYLNEVRLAVALVIAFSWTVAYLRWRSSRRAAAARRADAAEAAAGPATAEATPTAAEPTPTAAGPAAAEPTPRHAAAERTAGQAAAEPTPTPAKPATAVRHEAPVAAPGGAGGPRPTPVPSEHHRRGQI